MVILWYTVQVRRVRALVPRGILVSDRSLRLSRSSRATRTPLAMAVSTVIVPCPVLCRVRGLRGAGCCQPGHVHRHPPVCRQDRGAAVGRNVGESRCSSSGRRRKSADCEGRLPILHRLQPLHRARWGSDPYDVHVVSQLSTHLDQVAGLP